MISNRLLIPVCMMLIGLSFIAHVGYLSRTGFVVGDEVYNDLCAASVRAHGLGEYWTRAFGAAKWQGRVNFLFSQVLFYVPYFIDSDLQRAVLSAVIQFLSWICLAWFLARYTGRTDAWALVAFIACLLPYVHGFWPVTSFPIVYTSAIVLFFTGITLYLQAPAARVPALVAIFFSLFIYENLSLIFVLIAVLALWHAGRLRWPVFGVFAAYAVIYVAFRLSFPSTYEGTKLASSGLGAAWNAIWRFALLGQPGMNFVVPDGLLSFWVGKPRLNEIGLFVLGNLSLAAFLKAVLGALVLYLFGTTASARRSTPDVVIPVAAAFFAFLLQIPLAITPKYQQMATDWAPYTFGYFSFLCMAVAGWGALRLVGKALPGKRLVFAGLAMILLLGSALNSIANQGEARREEQNYAKWKLMKAFFKTSAFRNLPQDAVVIAPTIWDAIERDWVTGKDRYWTDYIFLHTGRVIHWLPVIPDNAADLISRGLLYYAETQRTYDNEHALLLFAKIDRSDGRSLDEIFLSHEVFVIGDRDYKDVTLTAQMSEAGPEPMPLPEFRLEGGAYVTQLSHAGMVVSSWRLNSSKLMTVERPLVEVVFREGFSGPEAGNGRYWCWSDGANGTGVVDLVNHTDTPLTVRFAVRITTAQAGATPFDLVIQGRPETAAFQDHEQFERVLTLQPGGNQIRFHSHGPRLPAPNDPRYLVFGLEGWTIRNATTSNPRDHLLVRRKTSK